MRNFDFAKEEKKVAVGVKPETSVPIEVNELEGAEFRNFWGGVQKDRSKNFVLILFFAEFGWEFLAVCGPSCFLKKS